MAEGEAHAYASQACPYCDIRLDAVPTRRRRCPSCGQPIHVRLAPDGLRHLIKESDVGAFEEASRQAWWRRQAEALSRLREWTDITDVESELRATNELYTSRDLYLAVVGRLLEQGMPRDDWPAVHSAYVNMAGTDLDQALYEAKRDGREPDLGEARRFTRESHLVYLRGVASPDTTAVVMRADCPSCWPLSHGVRSIDDELEHPSLPHAECERDVCRCRFFPARTGFQPSEPPPVERPYASTGCPYCAAELDPLPKSKKRCPSCGQPIHVRSLPDGKRHLIKASHLPAVEEAWDEYWMAKELEDEKAGRREVVLATFGATLVIEPSEGEPDLGPAGQSDRGGPVTDTVVGVEVRITIGEDPAKG